MGMSRWIRAALLAMGLTAAYGQTANAAPAFVNLSQQDFDNISKEVSANSALHNVGGAGGLGSIFGFEFGLIGGVTSAKEIEKLVKEASPSTELSAIPHVGLVAAVTVPFGITIEAQLVPEFEAEGAKYNSFAGALKWSLDEFVPVIPFHLSARGFYGTSELSFAQTINNASTGNVPTNVNVKYAGDVMGLQLLAGPKLPIFEPYVGVGYVSAESDLGVTGSATATFFDFTSAQSATSEPSSSQLVAGFNVKLLLLSLGAEYARAFGTDSYTGKLALSF